MLLNTIRIWHIYHISFPIKRRGSEDNQPMGDVNQKNKNDGSKWTRRSKPNLRELLLAQCDRWKVRVLPGYADNIVNQRILIRVRCIKMNGVRAG